MSKEQSKLPGLTCSSSGTIETNSVEQPDRGESSNKGPTQYELQIEQATSLIRELTKKLETVFVDVNVGDEQRETEQVLQNDEVSQDNVVAIPKKLLNDGNEMPVIGYEFDGFFSKYMTRQVKLILKAGYRHLDCGYGIYNFHEIGEELSEMFAEGKIKREELFISSNVGKLNHSYQRARENIDEILEELQLDYVDLMMIGGPQGYEKGDDGSERFSNVDYLETWRALEDAKMAGKVKSIGLADFNSKQIERIWAAARIKPAVLQIEMHPLLTQSKLREFCAAKNLSIVASSPFYNFRKASRVPRIRAPAYSILIAMATEPIDEIATSHGKTFEQVISRWLLQHGITFILCSDEEEVEENLKIFDFQLTAEEMSTIDRINRNKRNNVDGIEDVGPHYPFLEEF